MNDYKKEIIELVTVSMANEVMEANSGLGNDNDFIWCNSHQSLKDLILACQYSKRVFNNSTNPRVKAVENPNLFTSRGSLHQSRAPGILLHAANGLVPAWDGHRVNRHGWVGVFRSRLDQQSTINQESLLPWLTSANSSSLTTTSHNMAAMLFVPKNCQTLGGQREGGAVGGQSALAAIY
ncbi:hypothetical protein PoB_000956200 [Plakobranchus ocellatus]|uniref:Reverse transcriptase zinc-binding domain-containing protein n=1 Tax=Plakobranchus ocellatus TaxID=259542 RepID=A0AAV3YJL3_9GAST|nr:hypothetical protein PoB_000956200 [Plakobranchus ocellatus]